MMSFFQQKNIHIKIQRIYLHVKLDEYWLKFNRLI